MKKIITLTAILITTLTFQAQSVSLTWQKSYGTSGHDHECHITAANDGGYLITGTTISPDIDTGEDILIVKINSTGTIEWQKKLGGSSTDTAYSSIALADGGYIIAGATGSTDGDVTVDNQGLNDLWIIKLNSNGIIVWQKSYGGSDIEFTYSEAIKATPDGGFIVNAITRSNDGDVTGHHGDTDYWVVKFDSNGDMEWEKTLGGSSSDFATCVTLSPDGGYLVGGYSHSLDGDVTNHHGNVDAWIVKLNADGDIVWQRAYGGTGDERVYSINEAPGGGYYFTGNSSASNGEGDVTNNHGWADVWVVKLEENGDIIWQKSLGGSLTDIGFSGTTTPYNTYVIAGLTSSNDGDVTLNQGGENYWIAELDEDGELLWDKSLGGSAPDWAYSILPTATGYIISGESSSGDGDVSEFFGLQDFWIAHVAYDGIVGTQNFKKNQITAYPNPVMNTLHFSEELNVEVFAIDGKKTLEINNSTSLDVSDMQSGTYFLKMKTSDGKVTVQKIIKN